MFEPLKVTYINRDEIIEEFLEENPEYKGKELTLNVYSNSYNINSCWCAFGVGMHGT